MALYMTVSGIHGSASIAVVKDVLILALAIFLGIYLPLHYYGGIGAMFTRINEVHPELLRMPEHGFNLSWYNSTILLTSLGYYLYPHGFTAVYVARDAKALRRNAVMMPIYQVLIAFLFLVGFAATLTVHGLEGTETDLALLRLVKQTFAPWFVGIVGGAGLLTASCRFADHAQRLDDDRAKRLSRRFRTARNRAAGRSRRAYRAAALHAGRGLLHAARRSRRSSRSRSSRRAF